MEASKTAHTIYVEIKRIIDLDISHIDMIKQLLFSKIFSPLYSIPENMIYNSDNIVEYILQ